MDLIQNSENINLLWANIIIEELVRLKTNYFCISPGSRSTPLTIAATRHTQTKINIIYDERGSAFHALGYARATKQPAVLICTSGTAPANYYPAVIEAYQENLPVIVLSADRPEELRNSGANQTIDQVNLFGKYTGYFYDLPCPDVTKKPSDLLDIMGKAFYTAAFSPKGPVHINCMFREPLAPQKDLWPQPYLNDILPWLNSKMPFSKMQYKSEKLPVAQINDLVKLINENSRGIILAGRNEKISDQRAILKLAEKIKWPVFADITSGLKQKSDNKNPVYFFDPLLLSEKIKTQLQDLPVLHFGGQFVSKRLLQFLQKHKGAHIHVVETEKIIDPAKSVTQRIQCPIEKLIDTILPDLKIHPGKDLILTDYDLKIDNCITKFISKPDNDVNEISAACIISGNILNGSALFIASSMPVRDMDMFARFGAKDIIIGANRGASGIDGTIASAIGFAAGLNRPITLIIGDLAFIHDLNSLIMIKKCPVPVTVVLINNQGGGIFSFLPVADYENVFEPYFGTPHNYTFNKIAEMFDLNYFQPVTNQNFIDCYKHCQNTIKASLIEIRTNRAENFKLHRSLQKQIISVLP